MTPAEINQFRNLLAAKDEGEHADAEREPTVTWVQTWKNGVCVDVQCYDAGRAVDVLDRLATHAGRARGRGAMTDNEIPAEIRQRIPTDPNATHR